MGESMAKALDGKGEWRSSPDSLGASNLNERISGIKKALAKYPDMKIVATEGTEDDLAKAVSVDEALLRGHPNLKGIFGVSQVGGPSVAKVMATKEFGAKRETVKVFAFDDLPDTVKGVKEGYIQGIMVQRPVTMGKLAVEHLVAQIDGKEPTPADIDTGVSVVDANNLGSLYEIRRVRPGFVLAASSLMGRADDPIFADARRVQDLSGRQSPEGRGPRCRAGEIHALAGENGAGKSTLMKIMTGVFAADAGGAILIEGKPVTIRDPVHARSLGISIIYQELSVVENLSVAENIFLAKEPGVAWRLPRQGAYAARVARCAQAPQHRDRPRDGHAGAVHRPEADDRDRQGDLLRFKDHHHGRADGIP